MYDGSISKLRIIKITHIFSNFVMIVDHTFEVNQPEKR